MGVGKQKSYLSNIVNNFFICIPDQNADDYRNYNTGAKQARKITCLLIPQLPHFMFWHVSLWSVKISACCLQVDGSFYIFSYVKCREKRGNSLKNSASHKIRSTARLCKDTSFLNFCPNHKSYHSTLRKSTVALGYPYIHIFKCQKGISLPESMLLHSNRFCLKEHH